MRPGDSTGSRSGSLGSLGGEGRSAAAAHASPYRYRLLDVQVIVDELDVPVRLSRRPHATVVAFDVDVGEVVLSDWLAAARPGPGVLVLAGVVAVSSSVCGRITTELLGARDLIEPLEREDDELLACEIGWRALLPTRFAVLDSAFAEQVEGVPEVGPALVERMQRRVRSLNVQRAIAAQPRLEVRLALLLWHLASRWGRVEPGGVRLPLPLTHQLLGRLVGAERPSVSHALSRLARDGVVTGHGEEWHLHGDVEQQLHVIGEPPGGPVALLLAAGPRSRRRSGPGLPAQAAVPTAASPRSGPTSTLSSAAGTGLPIP